MCDVRILVLTGPGLDHEEGNSRQEKRDTVEFHNSVGSRTWISQTSLPCCHPSLTTCTRRLGD